MDDMCGIYPARGFHLDPNTLSFKVVSGAGWAPPHLQCLPRADTRAQPAAKEPEFAEESKLLFPREQTLVNPRPETTPLCENVLNETNASNACSGHQRHDKFDCDGIQCSMALRFETSDLHKVLGSPAVHPHLYRLHRDTLAYTFRKFAGLA
jgi:hypothetical protein